MKIFSGFFCFLCCQQRGSASIVHTKTFAFIIFGLMLSCSVGLLAQPVNNLFQDVVMPSPTVAAMGKFIDAPVNSFTGIPGINIPIHSVTSGPLSIPVSFNYHAGGMKVAEPASNVGMGWHLNAGGLVSRSIVGIGDEEEYGYFLEGASLNPADQQHFLDVSYGIRDGEPDIFSFSCGGYSGKFVFDALYQEFITIPLQNVKIEVEHNASANAFRSFTVTIPDGTRYIFGNLIGQSTDLGIELTRVHIGGDPHVPTTETHTSTWYLLRVESFDKKWKINLEYEDCFYKYLTPSSCSAVQYLCRYVGHIVGWSWAGSQNCFGIPGEVPNREVNPIRIEGKRLSKIMGSTDTLEFIYTNLRLDLETNTFNSPQGAQPKSLDNITLKSGNYCTSWEMNYQYAKQHENINRADERRMLLNSISKYACSSQILDGVYKFEYDGPQHSDNSLELIGRLSRQIDHWGYFNGAAGNEINELNIPHTASNNIVLGTSDRNSNDETSTHGTLKSLRHPSGNFTLFNMESNMRNGPDTLVYNKGGIQRLSCLASDTIYRTLTGGLGYFTIRIESDPDLPPCGTNNPGPASAFLKIYNNLIFIGEYELRILPWKDCVDQELVYLADIGLIQPGVYQFIVTTENGECNFELWDREAIEIDVPIGGLRVKSIHVSTDSIISNDDISTSYSYKQKIDSTRSSCHLYGKKVYGFEYVGSQYVSPGPTEVTEVLVNGAQYKDHSITPLSDFNGYHLGYDRVLETKPNGSKIEHIHLIDSLETNYTYPIKPTTYVPYQGFKTKQTEYSADNDVLKTTTFEKNKFGAKATRRIEGRHLRIIKESIPSNGCGSPGNLIFANEYNVYTDYLQTKSVAIKTDDVVDSTAYSFQFGLVRSKTSFHEGGKIATHYKYPHYFNNPYPALDTLYSQNRLVPYETTIRSNYNTILDGTINTYSFFNNSGNPTTTPSNGPYLHSTSKYNRTWDKHGNLLDGAWDLVGTVDKYDNQGNPLQQTIDGWETINYSWNTNGLLLVKQFLMHASSVDYYPNSKLPKTTTAIDGQVTRYYFDELQRITDVSTKYGNDSIHYEYNFYAGGLGDNYLKTTRSLTPVSGSLMTQDIQWQYYDLFGRVVQTIQQRHSPNQKDIVHAVEYNKMHQVVKSYVPFESDNSDGSYVPTIPPDTDFTFTEFEASPSSRVVSVTPPGWHATTTEYSHNVAGEVFDHKAQIQYPAKALYKTIVTDPNGNQDISYSDKRGRLVESRQVDHMEVNQASTCRLYDDKNRLTHVLPPGNYGTNNLNSEKFYRYTYDGADNMLTKKIPDKAIILYTYDDRELVDSMKDGIHDWMTYEYDLYGRETKSFYGGGTISHKIYDGNQSQSMGKIVTDYTYPMTGLHMIGKYTYDQYGRLQEHKRNHQLTPTPLVSPRQIINNYTYDFTDNIITNKQRVIVNNQFNLLLIDSMTYDHAGRLKDHYYEVDGEKQRISQQAYTIKDELAIKRLGNSGNGWLQSLDFDYLSNGYLKKINSQIFGNEFSYYLPCLTGPPNDNQTPSSDLFYLELAYDSKIHAGIPSEIRKNGDINQMVWQTKGRPRSAYGFNYDALNRLTHANYESIENNDILDAGQEKKYNVQIAYADKIGNIEKIVRNGVVNDTTPCAPTLEIDDLNFAYYPGTSQIWDIEDVSESEKEGYPAYNINNGNYTYDGNGNMTYDPSRQVSIVYNHLNLPDSLIFEDGKIIHNLYDHTGNKLVQSQYTQDGTLAERRDYISNLELVNSELQVIHHNEGRVVNNEGPSLLVLTDTIRQKNLYFYANEILTSNVILENSHVIFEAHDSIVMLPNFMVAADESAYEARINTDLSKTGWQWEYYIKDHLGNIRLTFADLDDNGVITVALDSTNEILEENHYYPFGMKHNGPWLKRKNQGFSNKYNYNGKEEMPFTGYLYYGFRVYDPAMARFTSVDPISDQFPHVSTFNYAENRVPNGIDLHGLQLFLANPIIVSSSSTMMRPSTNFLLENNTVLPKPNIRQTGTKPKFSPEILERFNRGRKTEAEQLSELGLEKNNRSIGSDEGISIPDAFLKGGKQTLEIKDVQTQSLTRQLRIQEKFSNSQGNNPLLHIRKGGHISKPLLESSFEISTFSFMGISTTIVDSESISEDEIQEVKNFIQSLSSSESKTEEQDDTNKENK